MWAELCFRKLAKEMKLRIEFRAEEVIVASYDNNGVHRWC